MLTRQGIDDKECWEISGKGSKEAREKTREKADKEASRQGQEKEQARKGKLARVGEGNNKVDIIHVENAAAAHLLAARNLTPGSICAGSWGWR